MLKLFKKIILRHKGFSLGELVISVGIMGVLALGVTSVMKQQTVSKKKTEADLDTSIYANALQYNLFKNGAAICGNALAGEVETADQQIIISPQEANDSDLINLDTFGENLDFVALRLENPREEGQISGAPSRIVSYNAIIVLDQTALAGNTSGPVRLERRLPFPVLVHVTNATNTVIECIDPTDFLQDKTQEELCASLGGTSDGSNLNNIRCQFNTRNDATYFAQTMVGHSEAITVGNFWAQLNDPVSLVVRDELNGNNSPEREFEFVNGTLRITNGQVIAGYNSANRIDTYNDAMARMDYALPRCWLTSEACGTGEYVIPAPQGTGSTSQSMMELDHSQDGPLVIAKCENGGVGIGNTACVSAANTICPDGEYATGVSSGIDGSPTGSGGANGSTTAGSTSTGRGKFKCNPLVQDATCPVGENANLIVNPDGSITIDCGTTPPSYTVHNCTASGWVDSAMSCTSSDSYCGGSMTGASVGTPSCCGGTPAGTCGTATVCVPGNTCSVDADCFGGTCSLAAGGTCSGTYTITTTSGSCTPGSSGPYISCFLDGTKITMADGQKKNIKDIRDGDYVRTMIPSQLEGDYTVAQVRKTMKSLNKGFKYGINWKEVNGRNVFVTGGHPFMTIDGSWKAFEPENAPVRERIELNLTKLDLGDILVREDGLEAIVTYNKEKTKEFVYNFEVSGVHEYIAQGYRVHNKVSCGASTFPCSGSAVCVDGSGMGISSGSGTCSRTCSSPGAISSNTSWCGATEEAYCGSDNNWHCRAVGSGGCTSGGTFLEDCSFQPVGATASDCTGTHPNCSWTATAGGACNCISGPTTYSNYICNSGSWTAGSGSCTSASSDDSLCASGSAADGESVCCSGTPAASTCSAATTYSWYTGTYESCCRLGMAGFTAACAGATDSASCTAVIGTHTTDPDQPGVCDWGPNQNRVVECRDSSNNTVADSFCSGAKPSESQSCTVGPSCVGTYDITYPTGGNCTGGTIPAVPPGTVSGGACMYISSACFGNSIGCDSSLNDYYSQSCSGRPQTSCNSPCSWGTFSFPTSGKAARPCSDVDNDPDGGYNVVSGDWMPTREATCTSEPTCTWVPTSETITRVCSDFTGWGSAYCNSRTGCNWQVDPNTPPHTNWMTDDWSNCSAACGAGTKTRNVWCPAGYTCPLAQPPASAACSGNSCGGKVICGELFRQGYMSQETIIADNKYADDFISVETLSLYQAWARPLVYLMQKSSVITNIVKPYGVAWAEHMAYLQGARENDNALGALLHGAFLPVHDFISGETSKDNKRSNIESEKDIRSIILFSALIIFIIGVLLLLFSPGVLLLLYLAKAKKMIRGAFIVSQVNLLTVIACLITAYWL